MDALEQLYENPFDDKRFLEMNNKEFDNEVNNLIEWCEDLDYEKYINNWHQLATSAYSGSSQEKVNLTGAAFISITGGTGNLGFTSKIQFFNSYANPHPDL